MTEQEYIDVADRVRISHAIQCLQEIVPDNSLVVKLDQYRLIMKVLKNWEQALFAQVDIEPFTIGD